MLKRLVLLVFAITICTVSYSQNLSIDPTQLEKIHPDNLEQIQRIGQIGNGGTGIPVWSGDGNVLGIMNPAGFWLHDSRDLSSIPTLIAETNSPSQALLNYDGSRLLVWNENSIEYWDTNSKSCFEPCPFPSYEFSRIHHVLLSADGSRLVIASYSGASYDSDKTRVTLYDPINHSRLYQTEFAMGYYQLAFSSDALSLIVAYRGQSQLISLETGEILAEYRWGYEGIYPSPLGLNPQNTREGFSMDTLSIVGLTSGEVLRQFTAPVPTEDLHGFSMHDGKYLLARYTEASGERHLLVWDWLTTELLVDYLPGNYSSVQGDWLLAQEDGNLRVYELATGIIRLELSNIDYVAASPDGIRLALSQDAKVSLWDLGTANEIDSSPDFYFSPGDLVAVRDNWLVSQLQNQLFIWDAPSGELLMNWTIDRMVTQWQFNSDGAYLVGAGYSQIVFLDIHTGQSRVLETLEGDSINDFALTADGRYLITASGYFQYCPDTGTPEPCPLPDSSVRIWDASTGEQISLIEIDESGYGIYSSVALSPDEHWLAVGKLSELSLYDFSGFPDVPLSLRTRIQPADALTDIAFSPDGSQIALGYGTTYYDAAFATIGPVSTSIFLTEAVLSQSETDANSALSHVVDGNARGIHYDASGEFLFIRGREVSYVQPISNDGLSFVYGNDFIFDNRVLVNSFGNGTIEFWGIPMNQD